MVEIILVIRSLLFAIINMKLFLLLTTIFISTYGAAQKTQNIYFKSFYTLDKYTVSITYPKGFDTASTYHLFVYLDANLATGKTVRSLLAKDAAFSKNTIAVGISHHGDWFEKRKRDFISGVETGLSTKPYSTNQTYGQANNFSWFLEQEVLPFLYTKHKNFKHKILVGHSLGGIFCFHHQLSQINSFSHFVSISPSLWINYYQTMLTYQNMNPLPANNNFISCGNQEVVSGIYKDVVKLSQQFSTKTNSKYYRFKAYKGMNHHTVVLPSLKEAIKRFITPL